MEVSFRDLGQAMCEHAIYEEETGQLVKWFIYGLSNAKS